MSTPEKILIIARGLKSLSEQGHRLVVIVSAMGDTTDDLVRLSQRITHTPIQREMDMLLSTGERVSMSLLSMALNSIGCEAISFTGSQSGVLTDGIHNNARITEIRAFRVEEEIKKGRVVIIAGFQGVNPKTKEITTLGRGGSDTTAVALAAHFKASRCDILTDVRGIYSIDPRVPGAKPKHFPRLDYAFTMEITYWGAGVLHYRSVELAERCQVPLLVHLSSEEGLGTLVEPMEETNVQAVSFNSELAVLKFAKEFDLRQCLEAIQMGITQGNHPTPKIVYERTSAAGREIFMSAAPELFEGIHKSVSQWCGKHHKTAPTLQSHLSTVTLTGRGFTNSSLIFEISNLLAQNDMVPEALITSSISVTFVVPSAQVHQAAHKIHEKFIERV